MLERGYPEEFALAVSQEMRTEYTSQRIMAYIRRTGLVPAAEFADEMMSILAERERLVKKHISQHAQKKINELYSEEL